MNDTLFYGVINTPTEGLKVMPVGQVTDGTVYGVEALPGRAYPQAYPKAFLMARYAEEADALAAVARAQEAERLLRPAWQAAIEHELRLRTITYEATLAALAPLQ